MDPRGQTQHFPAHSEGGGGGVLSRCSIGDPGSKIRGQKGSKRGQKGIKKGSKNSNPLFWPKILMDQTFGPPWGPRLLESVFGGRRWASDGPQKRLRRVCSRVHPLIVWSKTKRRKLGGVHASTRAEVVFAGHRKPIDGPQKTSSRSLGPPDGSKCLVH